MEITYTRTGDVLIPDLTIKKVKATYGKYGLMRKDYLKEYKPAFYSSLVLSENLIPHLNDIDELARGFVNGFIKQKS